MDLDRDELARMGEAAARIAREAGIFARENWHRRGEVVRLTHHDIKLRMDIETQALIEERVREAFPNHGFLGEEGEFRLPSEETYWIVDPIDGTMNYSRGVHYWCTAVAVARRGRVLAGAVYGPVLDVMYGATLDGPATRNGEEIRVSATDRLEKSILVTAGVNRLGNRPRALAGFEKAMGKLSKIRMFGAAALDICMVADGQADAMYEFSLNIWDTAAAALIARRAGAVTADFGDVDPPASHILISNPALFAPLCELLDLEDVRRVD